MGVCESGNNNKETNKLLRLKKDIYNINPIINKEIKDNTNIINNIDINNI